MAFPQHFLDELIARSDIVDVVSSYVALQRKGSNLFGLCPFHNEKTGSFSVSPDKQIYHCFGCKKGGGVINFIMEIENLSYPDAVRHLAQRANLPVPEDDRDGMDKLRARLLALNKDAARYYYQVLQSPEGKAVQDYLDRRKISRKVAVNFGMGASPDSWDSLLRAMTAKGYTKAELISAGLVVKNKNGGLYDKFRNRLMLPVIDVRGDVVGFGSRVIDKSEPKYMNTTETPVYSKRRVLYGLNLAKKTKRPNIILCEGNLDVVTLHQAGFDNAVASMGTALTVEQTRLLSRYTKELVLCYDNDNAGQLATQRALEMLKNSEFSVKVLRLPRRMVDGEAVKQDADDFIKYQGPDAFERLLTGSENGIEFRMAQVAGKYDLSDDQARIAYAAEISEVLSGLENAVEREVYTVRAAELAKLTPEAMRLEVQRAFKRRVAKERKARERRELNPAVTAQPSSRAIRYDNLRSAMAEEGVLRLLLRDESVFPSLSPLQESDFSSPLLGKIYTQLWQRRQNGVSGSIAFLSGELTADEMSHLTTLLQKPESTAGAQQALTDYIRIIREERDKRLGAAGIDPLAAAMDKFKEKKGYGGKRND
ncbi:MAG: DNA primase [Ruminococcaceae bacterium]|nr:DNA primase [Oscillospiraceae bacterium]